MPRNQKYWTLKVCTRTKDGSIVSQQAENELAISAQLAASSIQDHPGKEMVRTAVDSFQVSGPHGIHQCLLYRPLGMSFNEYRDLLPGRVFNKRMLQFALQLVLLALDYLHKSQVVHTGRLHFCPSKFGWPSFSVAFLIWCRRLAQQYSLRHRRPVSSHRDGAGGGVSAVG